MLALFAHSTELPSHSNAAMAVEKLNIHRAFIGLTIMCREVEHNVAGLGSAPDG